MIKLDILRNKLAPLVDAFYQDISIPDGINGYESFDSGTYVQLSYMHNNDIWSSSLVISHDSNQRGSNRIFVNPNGTINDIYFYPNSNELSVVHGNMLDNKSTEYFIIPEVLSTEVQCELFQMSTVSSSAEYIQFFMELKQVQDKPYRIHFHDMDFNYLCGLYNI